MDYCFRERDVFESPMRIERLFTKPFGRGKSRNPQG